jgi:hypothetical protein
VIQPDLRATIRAVTVVSFTVLGLIWIALAGACPMSDWYARRVPPRSYRQVALADVLRDLENHAVIPLGTVWEAEELKALPVTIDLLFFPTDREAVRLIAEIGPRIPPCVSNLCSRTSNTPEALTVVDFRSPNMAYLDSSVL